MRLNKKGFTLVELLAVIVILAVVMLIAVTAVGPLMTRSRKSALGTEGVGLVDAAKTAFQAEQLNNSSDIKATSTVCFDMAWLYGKNYFEKGTSTDGSDGDKYSGSVLVHYQDGKYTYKFWISNGTYEFGKDAADAANGVDPAGYDIENSDTVYDDNYASRDCGGATKVGLNVGSTANYVKCTYNISTSTGTCAEA